MFFAYWSCRNNLLCRKTIDKEYCNVIKYKDVWYNYIRGCDYYEIL